MSGKSRRQRKWGQLADMVSLLLAAVLFFSALVYYFYSKRETDERVELTCVFLISDVEQADWERYGDQWFSIGDPIYSSNGTVRLGYLDAVEKRPSLHLTVHEGVPAWESHPFLIDLEVVVKMSATYRTGDGLRTGDLRIAAGEIGDFRFGDFLTDAQILEVREAFAE